MSDRERNLLWLLFTDTPFRRLFVDHDGLAQEMIEIFHEMAARYLSAPWLNEFIDALSRESPAFQQSWRAHNVRRKTAEVVTRELFHPKVAGFQMSGNPDMQCCIFTAAPNTETAAKLHQRLRDPALLS